MSLVLQCPRSLFPFMELDELAKIHVLRCLTLRDIKSARLTCSHIQSLVDYEVGVNVVIPKCDKKQNFITEYGKMAETLFKKKVRGLQISFIQPPTQTCIAPAFQTFHRPNDLDSITLTGAQFQWLETLLTRCKNLKRLTYYTLKTKQRQPSGEIRPIQEVIQGFRDTPIPMNKLESLALKFSSRTSDYLCPMFLLFGGIKASNLRILNVEIYMRRSLTVEDQDNEEDEVEPTTAQRSFAYICCGRALEFLSESSKLCSLNLCLEGELRDGEQEQRQNQMEHPLPTHVLGLLNKLSSEKMRTRLVAIQNRNWDRLLTLFEWMEKLPNDNLRKIYFHVAVQEDIEFLTALVGRQVNLRSLKVHVDPFNFRQNQNVLGNILQAIRYPENMEELSICHYFQVPLDFRTTFVRFANLKFLKLHSNVNDGEFFHRLTHAEIPISELRDGYMDTQLSPSLLNLANDLLLNLEVIDLKDFAATPLEMRQILALPMLRKIMLRVKKYTLSYKCFGIYSSDLVRAMLTMRKLEYIKVEPVIFRRDNSMKIEVVQFESAGSISVPDVYQFLKNVGKLVLEADVGCSFYNGKYSSSTSK